VYLGEYLEQEKGKQNVTLWGLCFEKRLRSDDWIDGGKGRESGNCVLTADCVRGIG